MRFTLLGAAIALLAGASGAGAAAPVKSGSLGTGLVSRNAPAKFVPGEVLVKFEKGASASARTGTLGALDARSTERLGDTGVMLVRLPQGASVTAAAAALERDPRVAYAEPNYLSRISGIPDDPRFGQLWGLHQASDHDIDAPAAWDITTGLDTVIVAVIDSGVDIAHPDLVGNIWVNPLDPPGGGDQDGNGYVDDTNGWDFVEDDRDPTDLNGHGTHVAGTIGAEGDNNLGVTGVNWDVSIMALRAGDADGSLTDADVVEAIEYACDNGAHVVNGSFGRGGPMPSGMADAITHDDCAQTLFVFAAGNEGKNLNGNSDVAQDSYPCELHRGPSARGASAPNVLCVGATTSTDALAGFSNRGTAAVHLGAPGTGIVSTWPGYANVFSENFEGDTASFDTRWGDRTSAQPPANTQQWNRSTVRKTSGSFSLADSPGANYRNLSNRTILKLDPFSLAGESGCRLDYRLRLDTEPLFDVLQIYLGDTPDTNVVFNEPWWGSTGNSFLSVSDNLSDFDGEPTMFVRFGFTSDFSVQGDGVYIDDLLVKCLQPGNEGYRSIQGTSMAAPHVAGVAALLLADNDALTVAQLKQRLLRGTDRKSGLAPYFQSAGRLNARDSLTVLGDSTRPNTTITGRPANRTKSRAAKFRFRSNEPNGRFQCKHMNGRWVGCWSPKVYKGLGFGRHRFQVRAVDKNGNVDATPAGDRWRVRRP